MQILFDPEFVAHPRPLNQDHRLLVIDGGSHHCLDDSIETHLTHPLVADEIDATNC